MEDLPKGMFLPVSPDESQIIRELAKLEEVKEFRNVLRRALKELAVKHGLELNEKTFADRKQGNRNPKSAALLA